jgi:histidyl-tRNA synthetase
MATSGSKNFELDVAEYIEEAYERCGLEMRTSYDARTVRRSLNILLADWANRGLNQWTIQQNSITMIEGTLNYSLDSTDPTAVIDVLDAFLRRTVNSVNTDYSIDRISRSEYANIPNKSTKARPSQYFIDKQITPKIYVYPAPDNSTDVIHVNCLTRIDNADTLVNTMEMPFRFYPALAAGLAYYLSMKKAPDRTQILKGIYEEEFRRAADTDEDRASVKIAPALRSYTS